MDIQSVAWGIAVNRVIPPQKGGDPIVREIAIKKYADDLLFEQDRIIADFNAVVDALEGFVLVPKEPTLEMCHRGRNTQSFKVQDIYKAMIEAQEQK